MNLADFAKRADEIIALADQLIPTFYMSEYGTTQYDYQKHGSFRAAGLSFLRNTFGEVHPYFREFDRITSDAYQSSTEKGRGILVAARDEVTGGWAVTAKGIVSAEIFADFLEMAEYLLEAGYKDAAAVMIGSVLEEHLRQLARKHGVDTEVAKDGKQVPKKAEVLNADLVKAGVYSVLQQKNVTAWLDLRNKAAHGRYDEYQKENVDLMDQGVSQFMAQAPV